MLLLGQMQQLGFTFETIILLSAIYLFIRFWCQFRFLRHHTVHRGMFHSIPAAIIAAELIFFVLMSNRTCSSNFQCRSGVGRLHVAFGAR